MQRTATASPVDVATLVELLRMRSATQPDHRVYTFLDDEDGSERHRSYAQLDQEARAIGALLADRGFAGQRVLLLYPPGLDYIAAFFGCLYAGAVAVPAYPPRPNRPMPRIQAIVEDSGARLALTTRQILDNSQRVVSQSPDLQRLTWLCSDELDDGLAAQWCQPPIEPQSLALLQYTSGSTGDPKGVMVSHANLLHNLAMIRHGFQVTKEHVGVIWLPMYHDMGLIGGVLEPMFVGMRVTLMSPVAFLQRPLSWLAAIAQYRGTHSGAPNFAYQMCVDKISAQQRAQLDLSSWQLAFCAAEPVRRETLEQFAEAFAPCGFRREAFYPCFGMAESTLMVTGGHGPAAPTYLFVDKHVLGQGRVEAVGRQSPAAQPLVGCGTSLLGQKAIIVDPETRRLCPEGHVGEIWVRGPSVALGYWNQPEWTEETFGARLADSNDGPYLRTGDLGFLHDGELFITGRRKDLIIVRGRNHYPQDIELTVERAHPALRPTCGAAFSIDGTGEERLVVVQEVERQHRRFDVEEVVTAIREAVAAEHEVQPAAIVLVRTLAVPKTTSGKVRRNECRRQYLAGELAVVGHWAENGRANGQPAAPRATEPAGANGDPRAHRSAAEIAQWLVQRVAQQLHVEPAAVDVHRPLDRYALDSLSAITVSGALADWLGRRLSPAVLYEYPTIAALADRLAGTAAEGNGRVAPLDARPAALKPTNGMAAKHAPVSPTASMVADASRELPLSHAQRAFWLLHQSAPQSAAYNVGFAARVCGSIDSSALGRAMQSLLERHDVLRSTFRMAGEQPVRVVCDRCRASLALIDARGLSDAQVGQRVQAEYERPFDLQNGPLLRASLLSWGDDDHVLLLTVHHIACDGWSLWLLLDELGQLYAGQTRGQPASLPKPGCLYSEFVAQQEALLASPDGDELVRYWQEQLRELPTLELPTDHPRPLTQPLCGKSVPLTLSAELTGRLRALAEREGVTLYMLLVAAFDVLLHRYSGQDQVVVGSPMAGRTHSQYADLVGPCVNPVVLRSDLSGNPDFCTLLRRVRQTVLGAMAHQEAPFQLLVERFAPRRDPSRSPHFQASLVFQKPQRFAQVVDLLVPGQRTDPVAWGSLPLAPWPLAQQEGQLDLTLEVLEAGQSLFGVLKFRDDLWDASTIERMAEHLRVLLQGVVDEPARGIDDLALLTEPERRQLLVDWNDTLAAYPLDRCLHQWIEDQVQRTPDAVAVVYEDRSLTYAELNRRANRLARWLRAQGVGPDSVVGVRMHRSLEMVVSLLAVLKAGGAYLPLDPSYPLKRLEAMLDDARPKAVLTQRHLLADAPRCDAPQLSVDSQWSAVDGYDGGNLTALAGPDNLAYLIYTSGSTGKPKGVMSIHRGICNRLLWMQQQYRLTPADRVLQKTPYSFDVSVWEFFWPLMTGAQLVVARPEGHRDAAYLVRLIRERRITTLHFVPSMLAVLLAEPGLESLDAVARVICSGETLPPELVQRFFARLNCALHNLYGPTEASVDVTHYTCRRDAGRACVPIGRPIANTQTYVLNGRLEPTPIGVPGELHIGGVGLARGYLNQPALTAERFIPDPFSSDSSARLYKTGDLARFLADGNIEFLGRADQQVKLNGNRIELGDVEAAIAQHPAVRQAAVTVRQDAHGEKRLLAYILPQGEPPLAAQLRAFLSERLPPYMVPSAFVPIDAVPLSASGKLDLRALPDLAPHSEPAAAAFIEPETPFERALAKIWTEVLGVSRVGVQDDFFDLGGASMQAVRIAARATQEQLPITPEMVFRHPTVRRLAAAASSTSGAVAATIDLAAEAKLDESIRPDQPADRAALEPRAVLLTGGSGFLGAFLLRELLDKTSAVVYCLVRAGSEREGIEKLRRSLARFDLWTPAAAERIRPVPGDLGQPRLGLSPRECALLSEAIDAIYHNGALVNFSMPYERLRSANVSGTTELLRLATQGRAKWLHFVSTLSVFDAVGSDDVVGADTLRSVRESDPLPPADAARGTGYAQSKWVAEVLVAEARRRGLGVGIYRPGMISGHSASGAANLDDLVSRTIKGIVELGAVPDVDVALALTPVDYVAGAIVRLSGGAETRGRTYHLVNPHAISLAELGDWLKHRGHRLERVGFDPWRARLLAATENALTSFVPMLTAATEPADLALLGIHNRRQAERFGTNLARESLAGSGIACPAIDQRLLDAYAGYMRRSGWNI